MNRDNLKVKQLSNRCLYITQSNKLTRYYVTVKEVSFSWTLIRDKTTVAAVKLVINFIQTNIEVTEHKFQKCMLTCILK